MFAIIRTFIIIVALIDDKQSPDPHSDPPSSAGNLK